MECRYLSPILTSLKEDGSVDFEDMHKLYDQILGAGVDGILVGGSAGEFYAFTMDELKDFIIDAVKYIDKRGYVLAGTGSTVPSETIRISNEVLAAGADAVILVGPYYTAVNQEDVFAYFDEVIGAINGPVFLYNYIERVGFDIAPETILCLLAKHKNLIGIKDTNPILRHTQKYIKAIKAEYPDFKIMTGYDNNCVGTVLSGGDGAIGAISNIDPALCARLIDALRREDLEAIKVAQREIDTYFEFYEVHTPFNPVMKWAMNELGMPMKETCKAPLKPLTIAEKEALADTAKRLWRK